jgi:hypothetical protein
VFPAQSHAGAATLLSRCPVQKQIDVFRVIGGLTKIPGIEDIPVTDDTSPSAWCGADGISTISQLGLTAGPISDLLHGAMPRGLNIVESAPLPLLELSVFLLDRGARPAAPSAASRASGLPSRYCAVRKGDDSPRGPAQSGGEFGRGRRPTPPLSLGRHARTGKG